MPEITIRLPEVPPLGWRITRTVIEDIWALHVEPSQHEAGFPTPEIRALAEILRELWRALPERSEPRRCVPTMSEVPRRTVTFTFDDEP